MLMDYSVGLNQEQFGTVEFWEFCTGKLVNVLFIDIHISFQYGSGISCGIVMWDVTIWEQGIKFSHFPENYWVVSSLMVRTFHPTTEHLELK